MKAHLKTIGTILLIVVIFLLLGKIHEIYYKGYHFFANCILGTIYFLLLLLFLAAGLAIYKSIYDSFKQY